MFSDHNAFILFHFKNLPSEKHMCTQMTVTSYLLSYDNRRLGGADLKRTWEQRPNCAHKSVLFNWTQLNHLMLNMFSPTRLDYFKEQDIFKENNC